MAKSKLTGTYGNVSEPVFFWTSTFKQSHIPWSNASVIGVWASRVSWSVCSTVRNVIFIRAACLLGLLEPAVCFLAAVFYPEIISSDFLVDSLKLFIYEFFKCKRWSVSRKYCLWEFYGLRRGGEQGKQALRSRWPGEASQGAEKTQRMEGETLCDK